MITDKDIQRAIQIAIDTDMSAVGGKAFYYCEKNNAYRPRPNCLNEYYSGGESVICSVLLQMYFERHGTPSGLVYPDDFRMRFENSSVDLIWQGAFYFTQALHRLTDKTAWHAIRILLPDIDKTEKI